MGCFARSLQGSCSYQGHLVEVQVGLLSETVYQQGWASTSQRLPSISLLQRASWCLHITGINLRHRTVSTSTQHCTPPHNHFMALSDFVQYYPVESAREQQWNQLGHMQRLLPSTSCKVCPCGRHGFTSSPIVHTRRVPPCMAVKAGSHSEIEKRALWEQGLRNVQSTKVAQVTLSTGNELSNWQT